MLPQEPGTTRATRIIQGRVLKCLRCLYIRRSSPARRGTFVVFDGSAASASGELTMTEGCPKSLQQRHEKERSISTMENDPLDGCLQKCTTEPRHEARTIDSGNMMIISAPRRGSISRRRMRRVSRQIKRLKQEQQQQKQQKCSGKEAVERKREGGESKVPKQCATICVQSMTTDWNASRIKEESDSANTSNTTTNNENINAVESKRKTSAVSFSCVRIHTHAMILGDNPAARTGLPLTLDWKVEESERFGLDEYEKMVQSRKYDQPKQQPSTRAQAGEGCAVLAACAGGGGRCSKSKKIPQDVRRRILLMNGHTVGSLQRIDQEIKVIQRSRKETVNEIKARRCTIKKLREQRKKQQEEEKGRPTTSHDKPTELRNQAPSSPHQKDLAIRFVTL